MRPLPGGCATRDGAVADLLVMKHPSDTAATTENDAPERRRNHLRLVTEEPTLEAEVAASVRPRTIGRLIAQTAMIAETAALRRREQREPQPRGLGRIVGRFRSV